MSLTFTRRSLRVKPTQGAFGETLSCCHAVVARREIPALAKHMDVICYMGADARCKIATQDDCLGDE